MPRHRDDLIRGGRRAQRDAGWLLSAGHASSFSFGRSDPFADVGGSTVSKGGHPNRRPRRASVRPVGGRPARSREMVPWSTPTRQATWRCVRWRSLMFFRSHSAKSNLNEPPYAILASAEPRLVHRETSVMAIRSGQTGAGGRRGPSRADHATPTTLGRPAAQLGVRRSGPKPGKTKGRLALSAASSRRSGSRWPRPLGRTSARSAAPPGSGRC